MVRDNIGNIVKLEGNVRKMGKRKTLGDEGKQEAGKERRKRKKGKGRRENCERKESGSRRRGKK